jgi:H+/Cl- antiporter ClcA
MTDRTADEDAAPSPADVGSLIRSKDYRRLLILSAVVGLLVSLAAWCFLTVIPWIQDSVFQDLPSALGFDTAPWWWPLPVLAVAGVITAFAIVRLPGRGGSVPAEGLASGGTRPIDLPGILLAALATLGLGLVLGPSSPLIALGAGLGILVVRRVNKDAPEQVQMVMSAAGAIAALSMVFGSPVIAAVILIEAAGLGGPTLSLILLPGLLAAGIGSLVYLGLGYLTGLSTSAYALNPLTLPAISHLTLADFGWTIVVAVLAAVVTFIAVEVGRRVQRMVVKRPFVLIPIAGLVVASLAIAFSQITDQPAYAVLFSGSRGLNPVVDQAAALSVATIAWLLLFKGLAWGISLGSFRGGPVFPAIFVGTVGGLLAAHLPGFSEGAAVATVMGATVASMLRLPLSSVVIALIFTSSAGLAVSPLIIVAVVIAYLTVDQLFARRGSVSRTGAETVPTDPKVIRGSGGRR